MTVKLFSEISSLPLMASDPQSLTFILDGGDLTLKMTPEALERFAYSVQRGGNSTESVGQLYTSDLTQDEVCIELATVLPPVRSNWSGVRFDVKKAMHERTNLFDRGYHCVGMWHTHPESTPSPSLRDVLLAENYARAAAMDLKAVVFVIVGTRPFPQGLGVWIHDKVALKRLREL